MPKLVVTGGAGLIGSFVVDLFVVQGFEVVSGCVAAMDHQPGVYNIDWAPTTSLKKGVTQTVEHSKLAENVA